MTQLKLILALNLAKTPALLTPLLVAIKQPSVAIKLTSTPLITPLKSPLTPTLALLMAQQTAKGVVRIRHHLSTFRASART
jgi:hypothetical protein